MLVQAFGPKPAVERFDECTVGRLAGTREVEGHATLISREIHVARHELGALIDADSPRIARLSAHPVQRCDHVHATLAEPDIEH